MKRLLTILTLTLLSTVLVWCTNLDIPTYSPPLSTIVLGQPAGNRFVARDASLSFPTAVLSYGSKLFVADSDNNRVLIWNTVPTSSTVPADTVLGTVDMRSWTGDPAPTRATMNNPNGIATDGTHLFVVDADNHRILIWNEIPDESGVVPDVVLGQDDFVSGDSSATNGISARTFENPNSIFCDGTRLYVVDNTNHRVLIWNTIPTENTDADVVLGQSNFTSGSAGSGATLGDLTYPRGVFVTEGKLIVGDGNSQRLLIWNSIPSTSGTLADFELTTTDSGTTAYYPNSISGFAGKLFSTEPLRRRVVFWDNFPTSTSTTPDGVLGTTDSQGASPILLNEPWGVDANSGKVVVADPLNHRVLIWNSIPSALGVAADVVLGQDDFTSNSANDAENYPIVGSFPTFQDPEKVYSDGQRLFLADTDNHRVLIWNQIPTSTGQVPDVVVGQDDFTQASRNKGGSTSAVGLSEPTSVYSDGTRLYVADSRNRRILGWNSMPTTHGQSADFVVGHGDFTSSSGGTFGRPEFVGGDGQRLFVTDRLTYKAYIWNTLPVSNQTADVELGTGISRVTRDSFRYPVSARTDGTRLYVVDQSSNRVLIWNSIPTFSGALPDLVLGQSDFTSSSFGAGDSSLSLPRDVYSDGTKLYVADSANRRILVWNELPTQDNQAADDLMGQINFGTNVVNQGGLSSSSIGHATSISGDARYLYLSDTYNERILMIPK